MIGLEFWIAGGSLQTGVHRSQDLGGLHHDAFLSYLLRFLHLYVFTIVLTVKAHAYSNSVVGLSHIVCYVRQSSSGGSGGCLHLHSFIHCSLLVS